MKMSCVYERRRERERGSCRKYLTERHACDSGQPEVEVLVCQGHIIQSASHARVSTQSFRGHDLEQLRFRPNTSRSEESFCNFPSRGQELAVTTLEGRI